MKALVALGIVVAGAVGAFAVYVFGWHDAGETPKAAATVISNHHVYTLREGDVALVPAAAARCDVTGEAGLPNFFCAHTGRTRYQVVLWADRADLYDLARRGREMVPTYSVPGVLEPKSSR